MAKAQGTEDDGVQRGAASQGSPPRGRAAGAAHHRVVLPIWVKMSAALVVPLFAVAALSFVQVKQANDTVARVDEETALAATALSPGGLVDALIIERGDAAVTTIGLRATATFPTKNFTESMAATDKAIGDLRKGVKEGGPIAEAAYSPVLNRIDADLAKLRKRVAGVPQPPSLDNLDISSEVYEYYSDAVNTLSEANAALSAQISDPDLRAAAETLDAVNRMHDSLSNVTQRVGIAYSFGLMNDNFARDDVVRKADRYIEGRALLSAQTTGPWADEVRDFATNPRYKEISAQTQAVIDGKSLDLAEFIALSPQVTDRSKPVKGSAQAVANAANAGLAARIDDLRAGARNDQNNYLMLSVLVVFGATIIATVIARSVTKPMMSLTQQARHMATVSLPAAVQSVQDTPAGQDVVVPEIPPIEVRTRDEVQVVAETLNMVQTSALDLAVEQATLRRNIADSFVSMGRRTQNLIGLQLELITDLESEETDETALEQLYRLDHLATRARRNAESLVVLAGTESPRTGGAPVPITDIVRAMLSEVDAYQRVELEHIDDAVVPGGTSADLIHLLAELVENGLSFSPPDKNVEVVGRSGADGYRITVLDHGIGMPADKIAQANLRLDGNENFTIAPSRYLGHYVTGQLAARVGAHVSLRKAPNAGIAAEVFIPATVLAQATSAPSRSGASAETATTGPAEPGSDGNGNGNGNGTSGSGMRVDGRPPALDQVQAANAGRRTAAPAPAPVAESVPSSVADTPDTPDGAGSEQVTTEVGLRKRVPGSGVRPGLQRDERLRSGGSVEGPSAPVPAVPSGQEAQDLSSLLTAYTSGVERGRGEQAGDGPLDPDALVDSEPSS